MASLSPQGERTVLALIAEQYAEIVELRLALEAEKTARQQEREMYASAHAQPT